MKPLYRLRLSASKNRSMSAHRSRRGAFRACRPAPSGYLAGYCGVSFYVIDINLCHLIEQAIHRRLIGFRSFTLELHIFLDSFQKNGPFMLPDPSHLT